MFSVPYRGLSISSKTILRCRNSKGMDAYVGEDFTHGIEGFQLCV